MTNFNNLYVPDQLVQSFSKDGVVAFVGSGSSINQGFPSWKELLEKMLNKVKENISEAEYKSVEKHISTNDYLLVADFLKFKMRETPYKNFIEHIFKGKKTGAIQELITSIPFSGIITTNYDDLISDADHEKKFSHPFTWIDQEAPRKIKNPFILHAHGMANSPATIILSTSDYDRLRQANSNNFFWEAIKTIFQTRHVIFIGYSLNDPDFNVFLTNLKINLSGNLNEHHVLVINTEDDPLNIYRLEETMGITTIRIVSNDPIGDVTIKWLSKLRDEISRVTEKHIVPVVFEQQNLSKVESLTQINLLKDKLIEHLVLTFPNVDSINQIVSKFKGQNVNMEGISNKSIWSEFIFGLPDEILKEFILFIFDHNIKLPLIKRLLSHIPVTNKAPKEVPKLN